MIIDCISDLHGNYPSLPGGDLLIIAGDITANDKLLEWGAFFNWLSKQNYKKKILIGGNHDNFLLSVFPKNQQQADDLREVQDFLVDSEEIDKPDFDYLCDSGTEFEGLKIWGTPWTKSFKGMNPKSKAFTCETEEELKEKFELIPDDTDILISHGPPFGMLDLVEDRDCTCDYDCKMPVGSKSLRNVVLNRERMPNLKVNIMGHIHEEGGKIFETTFTKFINCSHVNENYRPVNKPVRIVL